MSNTILYLLYWCYLDIHLLDSHTRECDVTDGLVFHNDSSDTVLWMLDSVTSCEVSGRVLLAWRYLLHTSWTGLGHRRSVLSEHIAKTWESVTSSTEYTLSGTTIDLHMEEFFWYLLHEATLRIGRVIPECISFMGSWYIEWELGSGDCNIHETTLFL